MPFGASLVGATAAGYFAIGAEPMDMATSVNGALGAAAGYTVGLYMSEGSDSSYASYYPIAGAIVVPGLAGGVWDQNVLIVAAGAWAGCYLYKMTKDDGVV